MLQMQLREAKERLNVGSVMHMSPTTVVDYQPDGSVVIVDTVTQTTTTTKNILVLLSVLAHLNNPVVVYYSRVGG